MAERVDQLISSASQAIRGQITSDGVTLKPPTNIIKTLPAARAIYYKYRSEHVKRISLYALIEGLIAGNPPYVPTELAQHGLSHIANFNTLDGRSLWERSCLAYWNLLNEAETLIKFTLRGRAPELREFEDIMAQEWDYVVRHWPAFNTQMNTLSAQLVKFGVSPIIWPDERDFRWRVIELSKFFIPDQAQSDIEQLTAVCVESFFSAQYLFEVYEEFKDIPPSESPWNIEELKGILLHIANSFAKTSYEFIDFYDLQKRLQNGDIGYDALFSDAIRVVSEYYKEYDGRISHYMFHRTYDRGDFLYFADRQYKNFQEALVIFTASPGEYTIHSNRGLGHKIFSLCQAMNQVDCSIVDAMRLSSTPLLRGLPTGAHDFEQIRFYPGVPTNIGAAEFVPNNIGSNINQLVGGNQYLLNKLQFNTANAGEDPSRPDASVGSVSDPQFRAKSLKEFNPLKNNIAHFYTHMDWVFQNMVLKMMQSKPGYPGYEYAREWKERCIEQGVPEETFQVRRLNPWGMPRHLDAKASRVAGDGSTLARIMGLEYLMQIAGDFGPQESREFKRQWIMAAYGKEYVDSFVGAANESDEAAGGASLAGAENNGMQDGKSPVFSLENEHKAHFAVHMALATNVMQQIQQQQLDVIAADKTFSVLVPHLQEHYEACKKSPFAKVFVEQNKKALGEVVTYAAMNRHNAEKAMEAQLKQAQTQQANQQKALSDEQLKEMQARADIQRADQKVQSQVERAKEANQTRAEVLKQKVLSDADNQRLKIQLDAQNKKAQTANKTNAQTQQPVSELRQNLMNMATEGSVAPNDLPTPQNPGGIV